jgi:hypothetical protein
MSERKLVTATGVLIVDDQNKAGAAADVPGLS